MTHAILKGNIIFLTPLQKYLKKKKGKKAPPSQAVTSTETLIHLAAASLCKVSEYDWRHFQTVLQVSFGNLSLHNMF